MTTENMNCISSLKDTVNNFDELLNKLRENDALHKHCNASKRTNLLNTRAHLIQQDDLAAEAHAHLLSSPQMPAPHLTQGLTDPLDSQVHFLQNQDWWVGRQLWGVLSEEAKQDIIAKQKENQPRDNDGSKATKAHLSTLAPDQVHTFTVNVVKGKDWHIGRELHKLLEKKTLDEVKAKRDGVPGASPGEVSKGTTQPKDSKPQARVNFVTGNSVEEVNTADMQHDQDSTPETWVAYIASMQGTTNHRVCEVRATLEFTERLFKLTICVFIIDSGADMIVMGGTHWLALTPLSGPLVQMANVSGFDEVRTRVMNLPIAAGITFAQLIHGEWVILRVKKGIFNKQSNHTLGSTFAMRSLGIIVDDVHKTHTKDDSGSKGTQSVTFPDVDNATIPLVTRSALMTFRVEKPRMEDHHSGNHRIFDSVSPDCDPRVHQDDPGAMDEEPSAPVHAPPMDDAVKCNVTTDDSDVTPQREEVKATVAAILNIPKFEDITELEDWDEFQDADEE